MVFDVEVWHPGFPGFLPWQTTTALSDNYRPEMPGKHRFRARMRNTVTGKLTGFSPPALTVVGP